MASHKMPPLKAEVWVANKPRLTVLEAENETWLVGPNFKTQTVARMHQPDYRESDFRRVASSLEEASSLSGLAHAKALGLFSCQKPRSLHLHTFLNFLALNSV